ncbi:hypothetical protein FQA39_LY01533 [Lamprigera yunnana]|nr:hypothetical protein FQA39_LY01533 [Lamprigera yunnana]
MIANNANQKEATICGICYELNHSNQCEITSTQEDSCIEQPVYTSEMKSNYRAPIEKERYPFGIRRGKLMERYAEEIGKEIIEKYNMLPSVKQYCTEYDSNFFKFDYNPNKDLERRKELSLKHPLHQSEATTFYKFTLDKGFRNEPKLLGFTNSKHSFRKCSQFTKGQLGDTNF